MAALPTVFVPHGAPTFALDPGPAGAALADVARRIGRPKAILVVSAHWDTPYAAVGAALRPETIHDFWGFPEPLYSLRYPAPGSAALATDARAAIEDAGFVADLDVSRGLDHGAWIPLCLMYPDADIPVVPVSIQSQLGTKHHYRLGQALAPLRGQGVLILASGNITHNLRDFQRLMAPGAEIPAYVREFPAWFGDRLAHQDTAALLNYRDMAPGARQAHPADDHLLPFYVALGAAGEGYRAERCCDAVYDRMLAMDSYVFWAD
ncbi:MAG: dioxygenase [Rhodocyclaceae bacterium]|nr:dioxygenase [Rhodocyclaceae bacterium]